MTCLYSSPSSNKSSSTIYELLSATDTGNIKHAVAAFCISLRTVQFELNRRDFFVENYNAKLFI